VRELFRLRVIEYQNDVSTEARALPSQLGVARLSRYPPAFERERKMSYEDYTARDLQQKVKEMRGCLSTRPGCGPTPRQTSRRVGGGRGK
jgi:hypothetical protein